MVDLMNKLGESTHIIAVKIFWEMVPATKTWKECGRKNNVPTCNPNYINLPEN